MNVDIHYDVHFCLVSKQALANFLPILDAEMCPKSVVLFVSDGMRDSATYLKNMFERFQVKAEICKIEDPYDIGGAREVVFSKLCEYTDKNVALNITGGTKTMAIGAQEAFSAAGKPYFYLNHENNDVQVSVPGDKGTMGITKHRIKTKLKLETCMNVHGYELEEQDSCRIPSQYVDLVDFLVKFNKSNEKSVKTLNYIASSLERKNTLKCNWSDTIGNQNEAESAAFKEILERFEKAGVLRYDKTSLTFNSNDARAFANGLWFEYYVASKLSNQDITDKAMNVVVKSGDVKNELDVAFIIKNRLCIVECKTKKMEGDNDDHIREAIYKLESLKRFGGLNSKCALVSYLPIKNDAFKKRAVENGIKVIDGKQLNNLQNILNEWMLK